MDIASAMESATAHHREDRLDEAAAIYTAVLSQEPSHSNALHHLGFLHYQRNQFADAIPLLQRSTVADAKSARNFYTLALALIAVGKTNESIAALRRAVDLKPEWPDALFGLASALEQNGQAADAIDFYRRAVTAKPGYVDAWINLGNALQSTDRLAESIAAYQEALKHSPGNANIYSNLGSALRRSGEFAAAITQFNKAIVLDPQSFLAKQNLGVTWIETGQLTEASSILREVVAMRPDFPDGWFNLGNALTQQRRHAEAASAFTTATRLRPGYVQAFHNLGNAEQAAGNHRAAVEAFRQAIKLEPGFLDSHNNLGCLLKTLGHLDEAERHLRIALSMLPNYHVALCNLGNVLKDAGLIEEAIDLFRRAVDAFPSDILTHSNLAYSIHFDPRCSAADILRENVKWNDMHAAPLAPVAAAFSNSKEAGRRLRIGYLGVDFREHCQSFFTVPLFEHHDRNAFELFCYADVAKPDHITERLKKSVDHWRDIGSETDARVAERIREDRIDILVDLTMHMSRGRPLVMALKPAPVQVAWLAYPGTTGIRAIDYRLTDPHLDPPLDSPGETDQFYSERSYRLADTFWCYDPLCDEPQPGPLPADRNDFVTFGCLNNFCKVTTPTLELWSKVLMNVPRSQMVLLAGEGRHRTRLIDYFAARGIEADRIRFERFQPRDRYLRLYQQIDLGLDTIPYNGHTTSLDSFWMGVPVVTRVGETAVGRAGLSQLTNLGLSELAARTDETFVTIASELANDRARLRKLRASLRQRMQSSPLMDHSKFAREVEKFFKQAWQEWCILVPSPGTPGEG